MVYMYHSFLIHSSADGHLGCFHVLAIINSAVMNDNYFKNQDCMPNVTFHPSGDVPSFPKRTLYDT